MDHTDDGAPNQPLLILMVDDDPLTLHYLEHLLTAQGHQTLTADNGDAGLALAIEHQPHLVITDWQMPGLNGLELCRAFRSSSATEHLYTIMLTACETEDELVQAFDAGADDYVVKPFTPKVLEARIRSGERLVRQRLRIERDKRLIQDYAARLAENNRVLEQIATTDALTGLRNRRYALDNMPQAVANSHHDQSEFACLMLDIDHFKSVNDRFGHDAGDNVLRTVAAIIEHNARQTDTVSRIGGEEFLIYSSAVNADEAGQFAERLRAAVETLDIVVDGQSIAVTISIGIALSSTIGTEHEALIKAADRALYAAKDGGRNCVRLAGEPMPLA